MGSGKESFAMFERENDRLVHVQITGCKGWLQQRTNLEKTLLSLSSILLLTLLLWILVSVTYQKSKSDALTEKLRGCWSKECIQTAGQILSLMDAKSDACSNFYDFTCGRYGRAPGQTESVDKSSADVVYFSAKRLLESRESNGLQDLDSVKALYSACMDFGFSKEGQSPEELVRRLMATFDVGKWPVIENFYDDPPLTLEQRLTALTLVDVTVAFRMEVVPDNQIPGSYLVKLSPGGPRESMRTAEDIRSDVLLRDGMRIQFLRLGSSEARVDSEVSDILGVEAYFAQVEQSTDTNCDSVDLIPPEDTFDELQRLIPEADWKTIIPMIQVATGLVRPLAVQLHCRAKIRDFIVHLDGIPFRSTINYLGWRFFSKFSDYMGPDFMQPRSDKGYGVVPRWRNCLALIEKFASPVLADALTAQQEEKIHAKADEIVNATLSTTEKLLSRARWLSSSEKTRVLQKVSRLKVILPFGKISNNRSLIVNIPEVRLENFTLIVIDLYRQWVFHNFKKLSHDVRYRDEVMSGHWALVSGSVSDSHKESILVYFDKLMDPYLRLHAPDYLNYGGFGTFLAREISKTLLYMEVGDLPADHKTTWDALLSTRNSSQCLLNFFTENFDIESEQELHKALQEIFLDRISLEIAYESAKSMVSSSPDDVLPGLDLREFRMFFLAYAQGFCSNEDPRDPSAYIPVRKRINAAVSSFRSFSNTFQCDSLPACHLWM